MKKTNCVNVSATAERSKPAASRLVLTAIFLMLGSSLATQALAELRYAGSDTLEPVIEAAQVAYARGHAGYKIQIQASGTSSGLRELCTGRAAVVGASRPINADEVRDCATGNIQYAEIPVALDAVVLVVSTKNTWLKDLTFAEVATLYAPASTGKLVSWKQLRAGFPDTPLRTSGVGIKHGTFGFFLESVGLKNFIRSDFKDFAHHIETGRYVAADAGTVGFMPLGEARALDGQVRILGIDFGSGVVMPSTESIAGGKYDKLARTVYLYLNQAMVLKAGAQDTDFAKTLVTDAEKLVNFAGLIPLRTLQYQENARRVSFAK